MERDDSKLELVVVTKEQDDRSKRNKKMSFLNKIKGKFEILFLVITVN